MILPDDELAAIEALLAKATSRPWFNDYGKIGEVENGTAIGEMDADADGELIVSVVNALPSLVAALRAEREARARVETAIAHEMSGTNERTDMPDFESGCMAAYRHVLAALAPVLETWGVGDVIRDRMPEMLDDLLAALPTAPLPNLPVDPDPNAVEVSPGSWLHWGLYLRGPRPTAPLPERGLAASHVWRTKTSIRDGSSTGRFVVDWEEALAALCAERAARERVEAAARDVVEYLTPLGFPSGRALMYDSGLIDRLRAALAPATGGGADRHA